MSSDDVAPGAGHRWASPRRRALLVLLVAAPVLALLAVGLTTGLVDRQREMFEVAARAEARSILVSVPDGLAGPDASTLGPALRRPDQLEVVLVDEAGRVSTSSTAVSMTVVPADLRELQPGETVGARTVVAGADYLVLGGSAGPRGPDVYLFFAERGLQRSNTATATTVAAAAALLLVLLVAAGWWRSRRRLRSVARGRDQERAFTAHLAHELRTPVGALVTAASLVDDAELARSDPLLREPVELMQGQARRLRRIVEDLLEISRLETGQVSSRPEAVGLAEVARAIVDGYGWDTVRLDVPDDVRDLVWADPQSLTRLVLNLLSNAVRHARHAVVLTVRRERAEEVVLQIVDDGPGMPPATVRRVLARRAGADRSGWQPGQQGLGLLIAAAHADLLRARLEIDVVPGRGTTIRIRLPAAPPQPGGSRRARPEPGLRREDPRWTPL